MASNELNFRGKIFKELYHCALKLFQDDKIEESEDLCRSLLNHADLGDYHKAGCHMILGLGKDNYLFHAEQAVDLYENMSIARPGSSYDGSQEPTLTQRQFIDHCLHQARESLAHARDDYDEVEADYAKQCERFKAVHGRPATKEELVKACSDSFRSEQEAHYEAIDTALDEFYQTAQRVDEGDDHDEKDDDGGDDDDKLDFSIFDLPAQASRQGSAMPGVPARVPGGLGDTPAPISGAAAPPTSDVAAPPPTSDAAARPSSPDAATAPLTSDPATAPPTSDPAGP